MKCAHINLSFGMWIKNGSHWSTIHWKVNLPVFASVLEAQMFSSSSEILILLKEKKPYSSSQEEWGERSQRKRILGVKVLGQRAKAVWEQCGPECGYAPRNKVSFMNHTYYWGQKSQRRRRGGNKSTVLCLIIELWKELMSTSAKPLGNTDIGFSPSPWVLRGRAGIKGTKKSTQWAVIGVLDSHHVMLNMPRVRKRQDLTWMSLRPAVNRRLLRTCEHCRETPRDDQRIPGAERNSFWYTSLFQPPAPTVLVHEVGMHFTRGRSGTTSQRRCPQSQQRLGLRSGKADTCLDSLLPAILKSQLLHLISYLGD